MILSFFAFLIISLSVILGLVSFVVGLHNELPSFVFSKNTNMVTFESYSTRWSKQEEPDGPINKFNEKTRNRLIATYNDLRTDGEQKDDIIDNAALVRLLVNNVQGNAVQLVKDLSNQNNNKYDLTGLEKVRDKLIDIWGNSNLVGYVENQILEETYNFGSSSYTSSNTYIWDDHLTSWYSYGATKRINIKILFNKGLKSLYSVSKHPINRYSNEKNVVYVSHIAQQNNHYKLGQTIQLHTSDNMYQDFTFGGELTLPYKYLKSEGNNTDNYYIENYQPINSQNDFRYANENQGNTFLIYNSTYKGGANQYLDDVTDIAKSKDGFLDWSSINGWGLKGSFSTLNIYFEAMLALTLVIGIVMLLLDIIIAWFFIKEVIRSLSKELLFLKIIGMSNKESSLITISSLFIILITSLGLSLIGMLGIQTMFINLISSFVVDTCLWSIIQPDAWIVFVLITIFLLAVYYLSSLSLVKKMSLSVNQVVNKSDFRFIWLRKLGFKHSTNLGTTISFSIKNFNKIIITFLISFLVMTIAFTVLEFRISINENYKLVDRMNFHKNNFSYYNASNYIFDGNNNNVRPGIEYLNQQIPKNKEITFDNLLSQVQNGQIKVDQGQYIKRSTIEKIINNPEIANNPIVNQIIPNNFIGEFNSLCKQYDALTQTIWKISNFDFSINFGALYQNDAIGQMNYQLNCYFKNGYNPMNLMVIGEDDPRYKDIFKNQKSDVHIGTSKDDPTVLPVVISEHWKMDNNIELGTTSDLSNIDYHVAYYNWPASAQFKIKYDSVYMPVQDKSYMYVKKDYLKQMMLNYLKIIPNDSSIWKTIIDNINNNNYNSYYSSSIPITMQQIALANIANQGTLLGYLNQAETKNILTNFMGYENIIYSKLMNDISVQTIEPLATTLVILLVLIILLVISFIVFMVMTIMNENDGIIFIMKALGYSKNNILRKIILGYLITIPLSVIVGIIISIAFLKVLDGIFSKALYMNIKFYVGGPIIGLIIGLFIIMCITIIGISEYKITTRSLVSEDE